MPNDTIPLPEPHKIKAADGDTVLVYGEYAMHAHAAAVSAERDERIKVLEDALLELVGACDDDSVTRFEEALSAARAALGDKRHNVRGKPRR